MVKRGNLFDDDRPPERGERFEILTETESLTVERILSGASVPPTDYCQDHHEWVALLRGEAVVDVEESSHELRVGDWLWIPAGTPHTVRSVSEGALWLAVRG